MGSFGSLYIGISGLYASRRGLETVSHNIAKADNAEYVRQRVDYIDSPMRQAGSVKVGTGTDIQGIKQIRDEFLDVKLRNQVSQYGYWGERYNVFAQVESIVNETGQIDDKAEGGLAKTMDDLWKSFEELAKDPANLTVRGVLKQRLEGFVSTVRHMDKQLDTLQQSLNTRVSSIVEETNKITTRIADLNKEIVSREAAGISANDYRDQRNGLIDRLSQIAEISVSEDSKGYANIAIAGTHIVLEGSTKQLETRGNGNGPLVDVFWEGEDKPLELHKDLKSGELLAVLEARGDGKDVYTDDFKAVIPAMQNKLNILVGTVADAINEVQKQGATLDGRIEGVGNGVPPLFVTEDGKSATGDIDASNIKLNIKSLNDIAASTITDNSPNGDPGNGKNAEAILAVRNKLLYNDKKLNIDDFYKDIISDFGVGGRESFNRMEASGRIIIELDNRKQSISSVSLDEEMSDMLKFQHAYSASTRFINAIDEMIDNIINRMAV